jgi:hypothetical protein
MTARLSLLALSLAATGCGSLLDVDNPNNVPAEEITIPRTAPSLVNGALTTVARGVNAVTLPIATATDELDWVGSRDAWRQLDDGNLSDPYNEFSDAAFPFLGEGRWVADLAIEVLEAHQAAGRMPNEVNPLLLARAYLYGAIAYTTIGDLFEDWAFSDQRTSSPPLGEDNMRQVYDTAAAYLDRGLTIAAAQGAAGDPWELATLAMRARAKHARAVWDLIGNRPITVPVPNNGLVNDPGAVADALAALALPQLSGDWKFQFTYGPSTVTIGPTQPGVFYSMGGEVNDRQEMRLGDVYVYASASNKSWDSTRIRDPITGAPDPVVQATATAFKAAATFSAYTVVSRRELHLIVAEAALAAGDTATFATQINALRALNALTPWNQGAPQIRADSLLQYERQVNLFLQGRRLADHYRFGTRSPRWQPGSEALTQPGRVLPITAWECLSNEFIGAAKCRQ